MTSIDRPARHGDGAASVERAVGESRSRRHARRAHALVFPRSRDVWWSLAMLVLVLAGLAVLGSMGGDQGTVSVWAAKRALLPGQQITAADLVVRELPSSSMAQAYLRVDGGSLAGRATHHLVGAGEFVPRAALVPTANIALRSVNVVLPSARTRFFRPGTYAQVWVARRAQANSGHEYEKAELLIAEALIGRITPTQPRDPGSDHIVEVFVPADKVGAVLDAVNATSALAFAATPAPAGS